MKFAQQGSVLAAVAAFVAGLALAAAWGVVLPWHPAAALLVALACAGISLLALTGRGRMGPPAALGGESVDPEARYRQVLDAISDCILVRANDESVIWANQAHRVCHQSMADAQDWHTVRSAIVDAQGRRVASVEVSRNVAEEQHARQALQASDAFKNAILDSVPFEIAVIDHEGYIVDCNLPWRRFAGENDNGPGEAGANTCIGGNYLNACSASDSDAGVRAVRQGIQSVLAGTLVNFYQEYPCHSPTGRRWFGLNVTPLALAGGGAVVTHTDITERVLAEQALRASKSLMDRTGRIGGVGGWQLDPANATVDWTAQTCCIHELPPGHRPTLDEALDYYPPEARAAVERAVQQALSDGQGFDMELPLLTAKGRKLWVRAVGEVERSDGVPVRLIGALQDITARRALQAEAVRSMQLLRGAIDAIDEAFVLYDPDDRLVFCNEKYRAIYATSSDLIVPGARFEDIVRGGALRGQYAEAIGRVDEWVAERMARHREGEGTVVQKLADGRSLRIVERRMSDGHLVGFRIDITDMVEATAAAQQASLAKSRFLANMSHEIRTPMNAILGMLSLLRKTGLTPIQDDYASQTARAAKSLLELLDDILDCSKAEAGKLHLENRPFQIEELLADLALILSANVGARPLQLLFDVDPALPSTVVGDVLRMRQVLVNLCGNAIKFTERGEVVLSVERVSSSAGRVQVRFAVQDTGIGIAPENRSRIFDGFTQAEASTTRRFGGTGLGLSICKRLVELMGGELHLQSRLGEGSCFHFSLDLGVVDSPPARLAPDAPPALPGSRVLLIEPHDKAREMLLRMGRSLGWEVHAVTDARQALALLGAGSGAAWQLVLADALLPAQSGWAGFEPLVAALPLPRPALLVRASADEHQRLSAQSALNKGPIDGFLFKPCTAAMCLSAARQALHARVERSQGRAPEPLPLRLAGLRLLVVEDNATNQQVARELLQAEGAEVQLAWDGQQALEALSGDRIDFDLVLMDLQMPVMDGHTATRLIRHQLGWPAERLPIVAMTANALAADRAACLDAGMNDHIGKPFDVDALVALIVRLAGRASAPPPTGMALAPALAVPKFSPALLQAAEAAGVALPQAIGRLGGDRALYEQVLQQFCVALAAVPDELQRDATRLDAAAGRRRLHTLKGLAATAGAHDMAEAAGQGERALQIEDASDGAASHAVLADLARHWVAQAAATASALSDLVHALASERQLLGPMDHGAARTRHAPSARHASLAAALGVLAEQLDHADMAATDTLSAMQAQFAPLPPGLLGPLAAAMEALDFSAARICCSQLLALEGLDQQAALADACVLMDD